MNIPQIAALLLFLAAGTTLKAQTSTELILPDSSVVFKSATMEGVIFGPHFKWLAPGTNGTSREMNPMKILAKDEHAMRYMPSLEEIASIEPELKLFLQEQQPHIADSLHAYVKQYFGYIDSKGDTLVYINCFFDEHIRSHADWQHAIIQVMDGWYYFFRVRYNLSTATFSDLSVNGFR